MVKENCVVSARLYNIGIGHVLFVFFFRNSSIARFTMKFLGIFDVFRISVFLPK